MTLHSAARAIEDPNHTVLPRVEVSVALDLG
jgi:hypothetical protein